jgi:hypothetical protein
VPTGQLYFESQDGLTEVIVHAQNPGETVGWQTPWLYAAQLDVASRSPTFALGQSRAMPIIVSLTHEESGRRNLRRLRPNADPDPEFAWSGSARFMDLEEGVYRVEVVSADEEQRDSVSGGNPTGQEAVSLSRGLRGCRSCAREPGEPCPTSMAGR